MSDIYVEVNWNSGMETYSYTAIPFSNYQSLPRLMSMSDIIYSIRFDGEMENQTVTITLLNDDQYFNIKLLNDPFILEKKVVIKNSNQTLFTGLVREIPDFTNENIFILKVDIFSLIDREINKQIAKDTFPNCPIQNLGKFSNYIYGVANTYPAAFTAIRVDTEKFLASWNNVSNFSGIYDGDTPITDFTILHDANDYTFIECSSTNDEIRFSCLQKSFEYDPLPGDPMPIDNPVTLLREVLEKTNCGIAINTINYDAAWQRFKDRGHTGNVFIAGSSSLKDLLADFARSYNCFVRFNQNLEIELKFTEYNIEPNIKIHPTFIKNFEKKLDTSYLYGFYTRKYHYLPATSEYKITPADVIQPNFYNSKNGVLEQKYIIDDVSSWDIANRERYMREKPLLYVSLQIPKTFSDAILPGDYIYIKHRKHFVQDEYRKILVMRIVSNRKKVLDTIEGLDFSDLEVENYFVVCDANDPDVQYIDVTGAPGNPVVTFIN